LPHLDSSGSVLERTFAKEVPLRALKNAAIACGGSTREQAVFLALRKITGRVLKREKKVMATIV
jgi:2-C-methyl-D-erythritol 4-phosphate cytidylyltransferase